MMLEGDQLAAWLKARAGKLTASRMRDAMDVTKAGKPSAKRMTLMRELLAERVTGDSVRHFVTDAMQWGLDRELEARSAYEADSGRLVADAGFYDHPRIDQFGATPDGLVGSDGLIETKCPTPATFVEWVLAGIVPVEHEPQMIAQLACTGRAWCDFVAFDPRVRDPRRRLFVRRFTPTRADMDTVEIAAAAFLTELAALEELFRTAA